MQEVVILFFIFIFIFILAQLIVRRHTVILKILRKFFGELKYASSHPLQNAKKKILWRKKKNECLFL